jgi:hypothetical protein
MIGSDLFEKPGYAGFRNRIDSLKNRKLEKRFAQIPRIRPKRKKTATDRLIPVLAEGVPYV